MRLNQFFFLIYTIGSLASTHAWSTSSYLERFNLYLSYSEALPTVPSPDFITFITSNQPLSRKLREKWLYTLAQHNQWQTYLHYYQPSQDMSLQCYQVYAEYENQQQDLAIAHANLLWYTGESRPPACDKLFNLLWHNEHWDRRVIEARIKLALEANNVGLASYLSNKIDPILAKQILSLQKDPTSIQTFHPKTSLLGELYTFALKRLITQNLPKARALWKDSKLHHLLTESQQQTILQQFAIYESIHHPKKASFWFEKIKKIFKSDQFLAWEIRLALKKKNWASVETLIRQVNDPESPIWQYWLARSLEAQGHATEALSRYRSLAQHRHYYGFLASVRLKQPLHILSETHETNLNLLLPYQPILDRIQTRYTEKQYHEASRLLHDFTSELPKPEKSALIYWVIHTLHWFNQAIILSDDDRLINQLSLRFPQPYRSDIHAQSEAYHVPEALIYAMIRQESNFNPEALSYRGAHGLMQLTPITAQWISKIHHIPYQNKQQLFSLQKNIHLGTAYLHHLISHYHGQLLLTVAAYNAGPTQLYLWLKRFPLKDADIWIETIPFYETRNYLKNVMAYYAIYQFELHQTPCLDPFLSMV